MEAKPLLELVTKKSPGTTFTFVIVTKKNTTKYLLQPDLKQMKVTNPHAGTVVDTVVVSVHDLTSGASNELNHLIC